MWNDHHPNAYARRMRREAARSHFIRVTALILEGHARGTGITRRFYMQLAAELASAWAPFNTKNRS